MHKILYTTAFVTTDIEHWLEEKYNASPNETVVERGSYILETYNFVWLVVVFLLLLWFVCVCAFCFIFCLFVLWVFWWGFVCVWETGGLV